MKFIKWKILCITFLICLVPIILGLALWDNLPDTMAIHFDVNNTPDNYASREFVVFALPALMALLQCVSCFICDINAKKHGERKKFESVVKWIIPAMTIILQIVTLCYGMGYKSDIRRIAAVIVGIILIVIGNYMPKFDYIKNYNLSTEKARKINRFIGFETVVMGIIFIASIFFPPKFTLACIFFLIPYAIISVIYGIKIGRQKN